MSQPSDQPSREDLRTTLDDLHRQLSGEHELDPDVRARLRVALDDIVQALEEPETPPEHHSSLADRLRETALHFEESHPMLHGNIGSVIDALSRMGI